MKTLALLLTIFRLPMLDFASMGAGLTGGILGMSNAHELPDPNFNIPGAGTEADAMLMQAMRALSQNAGRNAGLVDPIYQNALQNLMQIDRGGLVIAGDAAGAQYGDLAQLSKMYSGILGNQAQGDIAQQNALRQAGGQAFAAGQDPQNQLHNFMQQQNVDQSRAASSARGIGMGANAAGLENDANRRFEMDWQNQQLGRMLAGLGGMTNANAAANQSGQMAGMNLSGSMNFGAQAPEYTMASAQAPIAGRAAGNTLPMDWANMFISGQGQGVMGPQAGLMSMIYPYLGMAQQGQQAQFGATLNRDKMSNDMQQQSQYGLWGGGQSGTNTMQGNQSGAGNPMNWMGMGGGGM